MWGLCSGHSSDLVTGEDAHAVSIQDIPESDGAVGRTRGHVVGVGVEAGASDISEVARKHPQRLVVVRCPETVGESTMVSNGGRLCTHTVSFSVLMKNMWGGETVSYRATLSCPPEMK